MPGPDVPGPAPLAGLTPVITSPGRSAAGRTVPSGLSSRYRCRPGPRGAGPADSPCPAGLGTPSPCGGCFPRRPPPPPPAGRPGPGPAPRPPPASAAPARAIAALAAACDGGTSRLTPPSVSPPSGHACAGDGARTPAPPASPPTPPARTGGTSSTGDSARAPALCSPGRAGGGTPPPAPSRDAPSAGTGTRSGGGPAPVVSGTPLFPPGPTVTSRARGPPTGTSPRRPPPPPRGGPPPAGPS